MKIVISQPMLFPWYGIFEQIKLADIFVHYDDVQFPQGRSFINRVQIKTKDGIKWLTVPLKKGQNKKNINETLISFNDNWQQKHLKFLTQNYAKSPFKDEMLTIVSDVYAQKFDTLSELNIFALETICHYLKIERKIIKSSSINSPYSSSEKLLDITKQLGGDTYITGWGALKYLNYTLFDDNKIKVHIMAYQKKQYQQNYGEFTPYVSILDLLANHGESGANYLVSKSEYYADFIKKNKDIISKM